MLLSRSVWWLSLLAAWLLVGCGDARPETSAPPIASPDTSAPAIRAVTLDARRPPEPGALAHLHTLGVTHLTLVSFGFQPSSRTPTIRMHTDAGWYSESDAGIRALARQADTLGLRLILKPHIWIGDYSTEGQDRHRVAFPTDAGWQQWEAQYRDFLLHYARLAAEVQAPLLVIGTELAHAVRTRPAFWRTLIDTVRTVYDGHLTYAANWYDEYEDVSFWDALNYVGVQAYFPLSTAEAPSLDQLMAGWRPHRQALAAMHRQTGKPILFTEIGYRSIHYAAAEPWRWPERREAASTEPDEALQARLYEAFFRTVWTEPWLAGAVLWKWHPAAESRRPLGFTPQHKEAERVIARWFGAPVES